MFFTLSLLICPFAYLSTVDDREPDQLQIIGSTIQSLQKTHMTMFCTDGNSYMYFLTCVHDVFFFLMRCHVSCIVMSLHILHVVIE